MTEFEKKHLLSHTNLQVDTNIQVFVDPTPTYQGWISERTRKWLIISTLIFYGQAVSICCCIRYGFLADSFTPRNVPGEVYGFLGSSLFIGYCAIFCSRLTERIMKRMRSRDLLAGIMIAYFVLNIATGLVYQIENTTVVVGVSFCLRILQGIFAYPGYLVPIDFINANFGKKLDFVNGLLNLGYFTGQGIAEVIGCILYDMYGYNAAFMFSAGVALLSVILIMCLLPNTKTYLSTPKSETPKVMVPSEKGLTSDQSRLSKFLIIPMVACMCINASYGVLQVAETPFLKEEFHKSITYGGTVLILASAGMATGSLITGILLQKKIFNAFTVMAMGALCMCLGMLITFPPEFIPAMYHEAPITAFPGLFIAGFGYPLTTLASLRALYNIQMQKRRVLPPKVVTRITGLWLIGYCSVLYLGSFVAGVMTDYVSYSVMAGILSACCLLAMVTCVLMRFIFRFSMEVDPDRKTTTVIANPGFDESYTVIFGVETKQCEAPCA